MITTRGVGGEGWLQFASGEELILPMSNKIRIGNQEPGNMKKMIPDIVVHDLKYDSTAALFNLVMKQVLSLSLSRSAAYLSTEFEDCYGS